jgi:glycosyltransferase involved in cell wall biosynthesis
VPAAETILVTHPGRQHSHQAALALARGGRLAGYWAGVPSLESHARGVPSALWRRLVRYHPVELPADLVRWVPWVPALRRLSGAALPAGLAARADFVACRLFDRWAARSLAGTACGAVIACEISALASFREAKRLGRIAILDAPSFHHTAQDRLHGFGEPPELHRAIVRVKDAEIALADHVLTVSELARETYLAAGAAPAKVHAVALGADVGLFAGAGAPAAAARFRFLFCGARIKRKAFDVLVEAFLGVVREEPRALLRLVGPSGDAGELVGRLPAENVSVSGPVPQKELAREFALAHCLVLASRDDAYGMVVAEALAAGCPVLVSDQVGAKELVEEGGNGWIVPAGDVAALRERMLLCVRRADLVTGLREACRRSAARASWESYQERYLALLARLVPGASP